MKSYTFVPFAVLLLLIIVGCEPEEIITPDNPKLDIEGIWTAGGADIAPILADTLTLITLRFKADSTYIIELSNTSGLLTALSGTYSVHKSSGVNDIYPLSLHQTLPFAAELMGIFEINEVIEPEELTFEYIQTLPDLGYTPPTAESGFGSTNNGNWGTNNINRFQRVE